MLHYEIDVRQEEKGWALLIEKAVSRDTIEETLEKHGYKKDGEPGPFVDTAQWFSKEGSFCRVVTGDEHVLFVCDGDIPDLEERF